MTSLTDYRNKKKVSKAREELRTLISDLNSSMTILSKHSTNTHVQKCVSILHNTRTIMEIYLLKCDKVLNELE